MNDDYEYINIAVNEQNDDFYDKYVHFIGKILYVL